jgi:hypothetical protein
MNYIKRLVRSLLLIGRALALFTVIWLFVELIYFKSTGEYLIYYIFLRKSTENFYELAYILGKIFNGWRGWLANIFSNYYVPAVFGISILVSLYDIMRTLESKRYLVLCVADIVLTLTIAIMIFI